MGPMAATPRRDENASIVQDNRKRVSEQKGVYGNIFSGGALGDSDYSTNVATYGRKKAA